MFGVVLSNFTLTNLVFMLKVKLSVVRFSLGLPVVLYMHLYGSVCCSLVEFYPDIFTFLAGG